MNLSTNNTPSLDQAVLAMNAQADHTVSTADTGSAGQHSGSFGDLPAMAYESTQRPAAKHRVSVIIPALNEAENLPYVLPRVPAWIDEVMLVDGNSTDNTVEVARRLRPDIRIVQQQGRGKGAALRTGFAAATGDIIVMLDADGSTDPGEMELFIQVLCNGADFVKASRFIQGAGTSDMPLYRQFGNEALTMLVRLLFGGRFSDLCYGYNAFWARVLPLLELDGDGFEIETMMNVRALRAGLKVVEMPSFESERVHGEGRLRTIPDGWRVLKTIFKERLRPYRPATHNLKHPTAS
ncbi:MAG TPA: glycosyltransferase family 2 protein [Herpetosiphonaceae bacterium]